jgi:hypothetical protein
MLDPLLLQDYFDRIIPSLSDSVGRRFCTCSLTQQLVLVGHMCGYEMVGTWSPWSSHEFMHVLLENNSRVYPNVWQSIWVAGRLPRHGTVLRDVSK